jgi:hypothetical protein
MDLGPKTADAVVEEAIVFEEGSNEEPHSQAAFDLGLTYQPLCRADTARA